MKISLLVERIYGVSVGFKCDPQYNEGVRVTKEIESKLAIVFKIETQNGSRCIAVLKDDKNHISRERILQELKEDLDHLIALGFENDLEAPKESVKVGEVRTLELRTDGKSTKIADITIDNPFNLVLKDTITPLATPTEATPHDVVNNPSHYKRGEIECYEALKASMTKEQFLGHLKATAIAYLWRYDLKNGLEDVKKAKWYVDKMVEEMESEK